jgi:uncharacterized NAD(P)/FAD-binding protein YdhS
LDIGVIGGGASAVCLVNALAGENDLTAGRIIIFEPSRNLWRGRPYQPDVDTVRVNAPPQDMSVCAGDDQHFTRWLTARNHVFGFDNAYVDPLVDTRFVPRATYGDYLEQSARAALLALVGRGWHVELVREPVDSATPVEDGIILRTTGGNTERVDRAVLCFGAGQPADVYSLAGSPHFVPDPYPVMRRLSGISPDATVAVIGSGLTAIDAVLALASMRHRGPIALVSRNGILPGVRQRPVHHPLRHFTPARFRAAAASGETMTLDKVVALMAAELAAAGEDIGALGAEVESVWCEEPVARLRRQLAAVDSPSMAIRILQQSVPDAGPDVWTALSEHEKDQLLRDHYRTAMSLCCPMPPSSASRLLSLFDSGQLTMVRGVRDIRASQDGGFTVSTDTSEHRSDVVINGVNARLRQFSPDAKPLIRSLVAAGVAEPHPRGGLAVERATSRLTVAGAPDDRLFALGDPGTGSLFFTFGVQSLVDRAVDIAHTIAEDHAYTDRHALQLT